MELMKRRQTPDIQIGTINIGSAHPIAIQSMTDTPTADIQATLTQTIQLIDAGSEMVRWTVNDDTAARAVPDIVNRLRDRGYRTPSAQAFRRASSSRLV